MKNIIQNFAKLRIAVLGDVMLDIFTCGISERLSPEAPVPVIRIFKKDYCAGGAGNVAENIAALGAECSLFGITGDDFEGQKLCNELQQKNISANLLKDASRPTTVKERFVANNQQLLRVDSENTELISDRVSGFFKEKICSLMEQKLIDAIIFSDYKKGVLSTALVQELIDCANKNNIISALDPKPGSLGVIRNLTILKPNRTEAFAMAGIKDDLFASPETRHELLLQAALKISEKYTPEYLVISLSADGLAILEKGSLNIIPTAAKEVFDVSGAGDTLMASMTCALASGGRIMDAAAIGNIASGIAVGKRGTSCVSCREIMNVIN